MHLAATPERQGCGWPQQSFTTLLQSLLMVFGTGILRTLSCTRTQGTMAITPILIPPVKGRLQQMNCAAAILHLVAHISVGHSTP